MLAGAAAFGLAAAGGARAQAPNVARPVTVRLAGPNLAHFAQIYLLPDILRASLPAGSRVEVVRFQTPAERVAQLAVGGVEVVTGGYDQVFMATDRGAQLAIVSGISRKGVAVVASPDITSVAQLRGKRIGVQATTLPHAAAIYMLRAHGMTERDVDLKFIEMPASPAALATKTIDCFLAGEPFPSAAVGQGARLLGTPYEWQPHGAINGMLAVNPRMVRESPDLVQAIVHANIEATNRLNADPDLLVRLTAEGTQLRPELVRASLSNIELNVTLDRTWAEKLAVVWKDDLGLLRALPNVDAIIDPQFVRRAGISQPIV